MVPVSECRVAAFKRHTVTCLPRRKTVRMGNAQSFRLPLPVARAEEPEVRLSVATAVATLRQRRAGDIDQNVMHARFAGGCCCVCSLAQAHPGDEVEELKAEIVAEAVEKVAGAEGEKIAELMEPSVSVVIVGVEFSRSALIARSPGTAKADVARVHAGVYLSVVTTTPAASSMSVLTCPCAPVIGLRAEGDPNAGLSWESVWISDVMHVLVLLLCLRSWRTGTRCARRACGRASIERPCGGKFPASSPVKLIRLLACFSCLLSLYYVRPAPGRQPGPRLEAAVQTATACNEPVDVQPVLLVTYCSYCSVKPAQALHEQVPDTCVTAWRDSCTRL
eukprot:365353-Chlamydomonas_euryale.AAC.17